MIDSSLRTRTEMGINRKERSAKGDLAVASDHNGTESTQFLNRRNFGLVKPLELSKIAADQN